MKKLWKEVKNKPHDLSGIVNPEEWEFQKHNGVWYPNNQLDLFEYPHLIPSGVQNILDQFDEAMQNEDYNQYKLLGNMLERLNEIGFTFSYYLDAQPYNLVRI